MLGGNEEVTSVVAGVPAEVYVNGVFIVQNVSLLILNVR